MKIWEKFSISMDRRAEMIKEYLDRLSVRERFLVIFTTIFVFVVGGGAILWSMHQAANAQEKRFLQLKDTSIWMQGHAAKMKPANEIQLSASERVQRASQQMGLAVTSQQVGDKIQIAAVHLNYSILANFIAQLAQMGLSIDKMEFISEGGQIKLTAIVQ